MMASNTDIKDLTSTLLARVQFEVQSMSYVIWLYTNTHGSITWYR